MRHLSWLVVVTSLLTANHPHAQDQTLRQDPEAVMLLQAALAAMGATPTNIADSEATFTVLEVEHWLRRPKLNTTSTRRGSRQATPSGMTPFTTQVFFIEGMSLPSRDGGTPTARF